MTPLQIWRKIMPRFLIKTILILAGLCLSHINHAADIKNSVKINTPNQTQIRCWQYGKLILDEPNLQMLSMANTSNSQMLFSAANNPKQLVYLTEIGSATCLIKREELTY